MALMQAQLLWLCLRLAIRFLGCCFPLAGAEMHRFFMRIKNGRAYFTLPYRYTVTRYTT